MTAAVVIAQGLPRYDNGLGLALASSLRIYCRAFNPILFLAITEESFDPTLETVYPNVQFRCFPMHRSSYLRRFLASLPTSLPGCVMQMHADRHYKAIEHEVRKISAEAGNTWCIVENIAPSIFVPFLKERFPHITVVYRSHDVSEDAFAMFAQQGVFPVRWAWKWEVMRVHNLEARVLAAADRVWAITEDDSALYERLHGHRCDGVLEVQIDIARYASVLPGSPQRLLYLGSSDPRKASGLYRFLHECWPIIHRRHPDLELWIGGPGTERFADVSHGVRAVGRVPDEIEFLSGGLAFINPQDTGTGIKLKSLVAMAAGRLLLSSSNGVRGIGGEPGRHYLVADTPEGLAAHIDSLCSDVGMALTIAAAGTDFVKERYNIADQDMHYSKFVHLIHNSNQT
ncbi:MAG: glycosyltransferase family 4 protein [Methylobacter sp.]